MAKRRKGRYPAAFRQKAVERMKGCENIVALSEELGVSRRLLYRWRHQLDPIDGGHEPPMESPRESTLRKENHQLKGYSEQALFTPEAAWRTLEMCLSKNSWGASPDFKSMFIRSIRTFLKGWPWASALKHCSSRAPIPE